MERDRSFRFPIGSVLGLALLCSACGRHQITASVPGRGLPPTSSGSASVTPGSTETGYASWYGDPYSGRRAANGEIYDKKQMTAAHRTLPFDTMVKVTDLENNRAVTVRINDRGPFVQGRIIDLSFAAAEKLAMVGPGTALVRLEVLPSKPGADPAAPAPAAPDDPASYAVQVGAFEERSTAERLQKQLAARYGGAFIDSYQSPSGVLYRVRVGPRPSLPEAQRLAAQLGEEQLSTFVVRLDP